jgi:Flp pilus assembly protein TadD
MFHQGVTCSDCHEPHSQKLRAPGNGTCLQCHSAEVYDTERHHFHMPQGKGAQCAGCHMPTTNFMVVHARHDHSIRIPRPDLSVKLGTPNACNSCHENKTAAWATAQMTKWYGKEWLSGWHFGETLADAWQGKPIGTDLIGVAASPQVPDIARATATTLLANYLDPTVGVVLPRLLSDPSPLVRRAALSISEVGPPADRLRLAGKLLSDPVLGVRIEAARVLSVTPRSSLSAEQQMTLDKALDEYVAAARASAEHPQSSVNLGLLYLAMGQFDKAEQSYQRAIKLDPDYSAGYVNLADLYRQQEKSDKAEATLLAARQALGDSAAVEHSLGLLYVRNRQLPLALPALAKATKLEPDNARYGYVYAVALDANGESARAIRTLEGVNARHPYDRDVLIGLVQYNKAAGNLNAATAYARKLLEVEPRYGTLQQIMQ